MIIANIENETWQNIPGFSKYQASTKGRVRNATTLKVLNGRTTHHGYLRYCLRDHPDSHRKQSDQFGHRLIAATFLGVMPTNYQVNHKDGNKQNNYPSNLEYVTGSENMQHAVQSGLHSPQGPPSWSIRRGTNHHSAILDEKTVIEMRQLFDTGNYQISEIAKLFQVGKWVARSVVRRLHWKHLP